VAVLLYPIVFALSVVGGGLVYAGGVRRRSPGLKGLGAVLMLGWIPVLVTLYALGSHD
jgi:hypothetical protein